MDNKNTFTGTQTISSNVSSVLREYDIIETDDENIQNNLNNTKLESMDIDNGTPALTLSTAVSGHRTQKRNIHSTSINSGTVSDCTDDSGTHNAMEGDLKKSDSLNPLYEYQNFDERKIQSDSDNIPSSGINVTDGQTSEDKRTERCVEILCPRVNCPEKIIFCLDLSSEMENPIFRSRVGDKFSPLKLVKRALGIFTQTKSRMNKKHQFGLVVLQSNATWVRDFTANPKDMITILEDLNDTFECDPVDVMSAFDAIFERIDLPVVDGDVSILPPPHILRTIFIYGRSHQQLKMKSNETSKYFDSPYFFVDVLYVHEPLSDENKCEEIFDKLCELDHKGLSYIFEASKSPTKIYDYMAQLLAHPLQRPLQRDVSNRLRLPEVAEVQVQQLLT